MKVLAALLLTLTCFLCNATDNNADQIPEMPEKKSIQITKKLTAKNVRTQQQEAAFLFTVLWAQKKK